VFDNSIRSSIFSARCSRIWKGGINISYHCVSATKKTLKSIKMFLGEGSKLFADFRFFRGVLKLYLFIYSFIQ